MDYSKASRQVPPELAPWDVLKLWVHDEIYRQYNREQRLKRIKKGGGGVSVDYDIEFTWPNAFLYDGTTYDVKAHLHVRGGIPQRNGGGIWVEGLHDTGLNWGDLEGAQYIFDYMKYYVE